MHQFTWEQQLLALDVCLISCNQPVVYLLFIAFIDDTPLYRSCTHNVYIDDDDDDVEEKN